MLSKCNTWSSQLKSVEFLNFVFQLQKANRKLYHEMDIKTWKGAWCASFRDQSHINSSRTSHTWKVKTFLAIKHIEVFNKSKKQTNCFLFYKYRSTNFENLWYFALYEYLFLRISPMKTSSEDLFLRIVMKYFASINFWDSSVFTNSVKICFRKSRKITNIYHNRYTSSDHFNPCIVTVSLMPSITHWFNGMRTWKKYSKPKGEVTIDCFLQSIITHD